MTESLLELIESERAEVFEIIDIEQKVNLDFDMYYMLKNFNSTQYCHQ